MDLKKAFAIVPREVTRWALRKADVKLLASTVMAMYKGAQTVVRTPEVTVRLFMQRWDYTKDLY